MDRFMKERDRMLGLWSFWSSVSNVCAEKRAAVESRRSCAVLLKNMELISWSLSAIDMLFSSHNQGVGQPKCPDKTFASGYAHDAWGKWRPLCLSVLSIEDIEDIYLFGVLIVGLLLIGFGLFLTFRKVGKSACSTATRLMLKLTELQRAASDRFEGLQQNGTQADEHCANRAAELQRRMDQRMDQIWGALSELLKHLVALEKKVDDMSRALCP